MGYDVYDREYDQEWCVVPTVTKEEIEALRQEAAQAGDEVMVHVCWVALGEREPGAGGQQWPFSKEEAVAECALVISTAKWG